jgi:hypothetical protein
MNNNLGRGRGYSGRLQATVRIRKEMLRDAIYKQHVTEEIANSMGHCLAEEMLKRGMIEVREYLFDSDDIMVHGFVDTVNGAVELKDNDFYKWCYENNPEIIIKYMFTKGQK